MPSQCPTADQLIALLKDELSQSVRTWIDAHLEGCINCRQELDLLAAGDGPQLKTAADYNPEIEALLARLKPEESGERIGQYKLLQQIGEGGFGTVWMAEQLGSVKRRVALKIIKLGMDTKEVIARFEQERQALAMMDHPNIAKVFDAGATQWGRPFFVMELVRGIPIAQYCDEQKLEVRERLTLFIQVCQAIQHAHQKGIIHRDLKPSNILISTDDNHQPAPKVIDFGVAKAIDRTLTDKTLFTQVEQMIGTPTYMSPEQAGVGPMDIDTRSDIYSLGVLLYELLTGKPPFDPEALRNAGFDEIRRVIREEEPERPSTRLSTLKPIDLVAVAKLRQVEAAKLASTVRGDLDWIVMKALEKNRNRRYETANGLAMDIRRHLEHEPVLARPPNISYKTGKFIRKHKVGVAACSGVVVALIAGLTASTSLYLREQEQHRQADEQRIRADTVAQAEVEQRTLAVANAVQSRERLVRLNITNGTRLLEEGDPLAALAWFAEALSIERDDPEKAFVHRLRIQSVIGQAPRLLQMWFHNAAVVSASFSANGKFAVTGSEDGTVGVWDIDTGKPVVPVWRSASVARVSFSPDSNRVLVATSNGAEVCNTQTGKKELTLSHAGVEDAAFSPDGDLIATASKDGTTKIWSSKTGLETVPTIIHTRRPVDQRNAEHLFFAPDGRSLATASYDKVARVWDVQTGALLHSFSHSGTVRSAAFSPDGTRLAIANWKNTAHLWSLNTEQEVFPPLPHGSMVDHVTFSPDGSRLVSSGGGGQVHVWDANTGQPIRSLPAGKHLALQSVFSPDGSLLMTRYFDGRVRVWSLKEGKLVAPILRHSWRATTAVFHPDGRKVLTSCMDGSVRLWDLDPEGLEFQPWTEPIQALGWSPRRTRLLTGNGSRELRVWDTQRWASDLVIPAQDNDVVQGFFSEDDRRLLTIEKVTPPKAELAIIRDAKLWDLASKAELHRTRVQFPASTLMPELVNASRNGERLLLASGGVVEAWDVVAGKRLFRTDRHAPNPRSLLFNPEATKVAFTCGKLLHVFGAGGERLYPDLKNAMSLYAAHFSPDGQRLVTVDSDDSYGDGEARIWDTATGTLIRALPHRDGVDCAASSPDGRWLATGGESKDARVFDVETGQPIGFRMRHEAAVGSVAFSDDARFLGTATNSGTVQVWEVSTGEIVTPPLKTDEKVEDVFFLPGNRVLVTRGPKGFRFWRLQTEGKTPEDLEERARLLAAHYLDRSAAMEPLDVGTMRKIWSQWQRSLSDEPMVSKRGSSIAVLPAKPSTRVAIQSLVKSYLDNGIWQNALPLMTELSADNPDDTIFALNIAILQAWFGENADHASNCRRILNLAEGTSDPSAADRAAKAYCVLPSSDPQLLQVALGLAERAVNLGQGHPFLPYYQMSLGLAKYRQGDYKGADEALAAAENAVDAHRHVREAAAFFRAMSLFRQGKIADARLRFSEAEAKMKPPPADERQPLADKAEADDLVIWMAHKEAKALLAE